MTLNFFCICWQQGSQDLVVFVFVFVAITTAQSLAKPHNSVTSIMLMSSATVSCRAGVMVAVCLLLLHSAFQHRTLSVRTRVGGTPEPCVACVRGVISRARRFYFSLIGFCSCNHPVRLGQIFDSVDFYQNLQSY